MIGFVHDLVSSQILAPQSDEARGDARVFVDPESRPLDSNPNEIDLLSVRTVPLAGSEEIGGGVTLRHEVVVGVVVQHGDAVEARRIRDRIVLDVCLRAGDAWDEISQEVDPISGQYVTRLAWSVDWRPLTVDTPNESATVTFTIDTQLDR